MDLINFDAAGPRSLLDFIDSGCAAHASRGNLGAAPSWWLCWMPHRAQWRATARSGRSRRRGNSGAPERLLRRLRERGQDQEADALLDSEVARGTPWALWVQAHRAVRPAGGGRRVARGLLERAANARVGQAVKTVLMERAERAWRGDEADQWAACRRPRLHHAVVELIRSREKAGRLEEAEQLAWKAPAGQRSWALRRLAQDRTGAGHALAAARLRRGLGMGAGHARRTPGKSRRVHRG